MNNQVEWKTRFEHEIATAEQARTRNNEGMARVCARRAAGIVIAEFLARRGNQARKPSAIEQLRYLINLPDLDETTRQTAAHFLIHLDKEHHLPVDADLVAEARWLAQDLLG